MSCLKHQESWHVCTKHQDISEKVTASYTACHNQISHAQTLNFSKKTFSTCAWLRYNLPFFPFKTNYMQSDLKRWLMSRWQSFLLPMNIPFEYLCYLIYNDTPPYWWETGMKEAAKRKHISDLCPTLCSCGYRENKWLDINQWRIVSSPLFISQQWIMHFKVKVWWQVFCSFWAVFQHFSMFLAP